MSAIGAVAGLLIAIILIIKKVSPTYSLIAGAIIGGLSGGFSLVETVEYMVTGVKEIVPAIIHILTAGILSGILIKTGAADSISHTIINKLGEKNAYLALALATMLLTGIGVFIDVAVITVAPVALMIGQNLSIPKLKLLLVMIGGGKCGNIISPNPNTIIAAENFNAPLPSVMFVNIIPAIIGLLVTVYIVARLMPASKTTYENNIVSNSQATDMPSFASSIVAPIVTVILLALRPLFGIIIDPLIALPVGGIVGIIAMRKWHVLETGMQYGLEKMSVVAVLLVGTGTIAGVIKASSLKDVILDVLSKSSLGDTLIAPISGALMSAATASTTAGATIASSSFAQTILAAGISAVWGAAMINSGATVLDHLPHGSFFHATGGSVDISIKERLKLIPYETAIGATLTICTVLGYYFVK